MMTQIKFRVFTALIEHPFGVVSSKPRHLAHEFPNAHLPPMHAWCNEMFGDNCTCSLSNFYFNTDDDRTLFLLRWS